MKPDISVIIPVLNEEARINAAISCLFSQQFAGTFEIIAVDGHKDGTTLACIHDPRVKKAVSAPGRGRQMNQGAIMAKGETLLFLHADTILPPNALTLVRFVMRNPAISAGAFDLAIHHGSWVYRVIEKTASLRSRLTRIPYGDQAIFVKKVFFFRLGQYKEIPIMEDVDLMQRVKRAWGRISFISTPVRTSARRWEKEGKIRCTLRNWSLISLYLLGVRPERLTRFYKAMQAEK